MAAAAPLINTPILVNKYGRNFSVMYYNGNLFRADPVSFRKTYSVYENVSSSTYIPTEMITASDVYSDRSIKYFTANKGEVERIYAPRGAPFIYTWQSSASLLLLNMTHEQTYLNVLELLAEENKKNAIRTAFKQTSEGIKRFSTQESQMKNDLALQSICELGFDGYYTAAQVEPYQFHSEIGLCSFAFPKLQLVRIDKHALSVRNSVGWAVGQNLTSVPRKSRSRLYANHTPNNNYIMPGFNYSRRRKRKQSRKTRRR